MMTPEELAMRLEDVSLPKGVELHEILSPVPNRSGWMGILFRVPSSLEEQLKVGIFECDPGQPLEQIIERMKATAAELLEKFPLTA